MLYSDHQSVDDLLPSLIGGLKASDRWSDRCSGIMDQVVNSKVHYQLCLIYCSLTIRVEGDMVSEYKLLRTIACTS